MQAPGESPVPVAPVPVADGNRWRFSDIPYIVLGNRTFSLAVACGAGLIASQIALLFNFRVAVALFLCLVGGLAVALEPFLGIVGYLILAFMRPQDVFWGLGAERFTMLVSVATIAATMLHYTRRPRLSFLASPQLLLVLILWLSIWLSTVYGKFAEPQPRYLGYYNKLFLTYFVVVAVVTNLRKLEIAAGVTALSLGYLCYWANERHFRDGWDVVHGPGYEGYTFYDHNDFAMVMVMTLPMLWFLHRRTWKSHRFLSLLFLGLLPLGCHGVMLTYSRGGFLGMCMVLGYIAVRERDRRFAGTLIVGGVTFFLLFTGESYRARILSIGDYQEDTSAQGRLNSWEAGRAMIADSPFFGVGLKEYTRAFPQYSTKEDLVAHNSWLQLAAECGLPAVLSWAFLIALSGVSILKVWHRAPMLLPEDRRRTQALAHAWGGSLVGYLVCGFFLSVEDLELFYVLVALIQILDRLSAEAVKEANAAAKARPAPA